MKSKLLFFLVLTLFCINVSAQKGKLFPSISGLTLDDKPITLPVKNGKMSVIVVVFSRNAEDELKKWLSPLYSTFIEKGQAVMDVYDVNFTFIPMIGGFKRIVEEFKGSTDKEFWPYIMDTDKTDMKLQQKLLEVKNTNTTYVMVVDKDGKIVEVQTGAFKEDKMDKIEDACDED
jgi:hypothetical protein